MKKQYVSPLEAMFSHDLREMTIVYANHIHDAGGYAWDVEISAPWRTYSEKRVEIKILFELIIAGPRQYDISISEENREKSVAFRYSTWEPHQIRDALIGFDQRLSKILVDGRN